MGWYGRCVVTVAAVTVGAGIVAGAAAAVGAPDAGPAPSPAYTSHVTITTGPLTDAQQAAERWHRRGPADYRFVWRSEAMVGISRTLIEVRAGRVVAERVLEVRGQLWQAPPRSVDEVFARLHTAEERASSVQVDYDQALGYPRSFRVDNIAGAVDDEQSFGIESLQPR